ncbi:LAGLIDADG endonuclease [bacterium BMS3Abin02]|nr:LAGLIDADG endonuclease [bacterium BMS3Abin02]GBE21411.1 LAGLIDADG endonuclease [bacterium BMS3Bbin01]HDH25916.1 hypothetical protein [Actinomycetota bacterium]
MSSDKPSGADNQQGRLEAYLSGFADGEGSFSVGITRRSDLAFGFQLIHEFRVSQNAERSTVLEYFRDVLKCGRIVINDRHRMSDKTLVFVVRRRRDLLDHVIPFFERNPLLSDKQQTFVSFATIVQAMAEKVHLEYEGFVQLVRLAFTMNANGAYRKWKMSDVIGVQNPQRLYAEHLDW